MNSPFDVTRYQDPVTIQRVLHTAKTIAIVGLSKNPLRASYFVGFYCNRHGYRVIPVNPRESTILGGTSYASLTEVTEPIDLVAVFRAPAALPDIAREAGAVGAKTLWCQFGVVNEEGAASRRKGASRWSWTVASRSSTPGTRAACTGWDITSSASRRSAAACNKRSGVSRDGIVRDYRADVVARGASSSGA